MTVSPSLGGVNLNTVMTPAVVPAARRPHLHTKQHRILMRGRYHQEGDDCGKERGSPEVRGKACDAVDAPARPVGRLQLQHVVVLGVKVVQADDTVLLRGGGQGVIAGPANLKVKVRESKRRGTTKQCVSPIVLHVPNNQSWLHLQLRRSLPCSSSKLHLG